MISRIPEKESYINRRSTRGLTGGETYSIKVLRTKEKTERDGSEMGSKGDQRVKTGEKRVRTVGSTNSVDCTHGYLASFPGSSPAFCCILYCMRQKAGEEPGNKAMDTIFNMQYTNSSSPPWTYYWHLISKLSLCCPS